MGKVEEGEKLTAKCGKIETDHSLLVLLREGRTQGMFLLFFFSCKLLVCLTPRQCNYQSEEKKLSLHGFFPEIGCQSQDFFCLRAF